MLEATRRRWLMLGDVSVKGHHPVSRNRDRLIAVDALRGLAILGMVVFHLAWDLHAFGWTEVDPSAAPLWRWFGEVVASCFLFLSGFALVLARVRGAGPRQALARIGIIAAASLGVTVATAIATPGETVWFGILHCIALGNVLALPLLGVAPALILASALAAIAAPFIVAGHAPAAWWWLGLSDRWPTTIDARPLLPWLGVVLLGVWAGRLSGSSRLYRLGPKANRLAVPLAAAGRHSLAIYLTHQPLLFGVFWTIAATPLAPGPRPVPDAAFTEQCQATCGKAASADSCTLFCACAHWRLQDRVSQGPVTPDEIGEAARACGADGDVPELR